jgi:hypothetical protein
VTTLIIAFPSSLKSHYGLDKKAVNEYTGPSDRVKPLFSDLAKPHLMLLKS